VDTSDRRRLLFVIGFVLLGIGVATANVGLLLFAGALATLSGVMLLWGWEAWRGVEVTARFTPARVFGREPTTLVVRVANRKRIPVPVVRMAVWLPQGLHPALEQETSIRGFSRRFFLGPRSEVAFELPVRTSRRGEYWLDRVRMELADPFDLAPIGGEVFPETAVMVLPQPTIRVPVDIRRRLPFGSPAPAARMFEQRERFGGIRPYEPGDPLNRIHWKLTGHTGNLQTKIFEPTRSAEVLLVLDMAAGEPFWDSVYPRIAENTIGWASFLARLAIESGWRVGLIANTHFTRGRGPIRVPPSSVAGHEAMLFAALAMMPNEPTSDLGPVLREVGRSLGRHSTALILTPRPGPGLQHEIALHRRRGVEVTQVSPLESFARTPKGAG
jgi:uncharacterized protein (DUF58 family)